MIKNTLQKILKTDGHYAGDLVSLDFKSQSLHKFLQNVVTLVNQHSQKINLLQLDKMSIERIKLGNQKLSLSNKLSPAILTTLPNIPHKYKNQNYEDTIQQISYNMKLTTHSLQYLYDSLKKKDQQLSHINSQLPLFQKTDTCGDTIKKSILTCKKYSDDQNDKILNRLKQLEVKTNKKISDFQNIIKETQKKTLWKINECQSHLLKKITPDYVEKALEQLQLKIFNDIKNNKNHELNQFKFNLQTLKNKMQILNNNIYQYQKQSKTMIKNIQENSKLLQKKDKVEQDKIQLDLKIKELLIKIERLQKREDPQYLQLRFTKLTSEHQQKLLSHTQKIKKLQHQLESINNVMSSMNVGTGGFDPHKLCQIDGDVRRLRDSNRTCQTKLQVLQQQVKTKLLLFQQRIMTTLGMLKGQDNYVSRDQLYESLSRLRQPVTQRMTQNQNLITQLNSKIVKLQLFQKATKRKIKQLTKGDDLNKILDMKMGIAQAQTNFQAINMKLQNLEILFNKVKMDIQSYSGFLQYLQKQINQPEQGINILGPKQKVFPAKCLGCGYKHNPIHENNMMMGSDGKYYKVDLRNTYLDSKQVYGVTPSQLAILDTTSLKKSRLYSVTRPTSSKTNLRPNSAHKYQ